METSFLFLIFADNINQNSSAMKQILEIAYSRYNSIEELPESDYQLVREAEEATKNAHAPYSNFHVGAAVRLQSGLTFHASNFESEVYPAGLCAERSLLFYIESNYGDDPIETLAIASDPSERECYPCGQCRQVIVDVERRQKHPIRVIMSGAGGATILDTAEKLLPFTFKL
jgi:cytidine deaminase